MLRRVGGWAWGAAFLGSGELVEKYCAGSSPPPVDPGRTSGIRHRGRRSLCPPVGHHVVLPAASVRGACGSAAAPGAPCSLFPQHERSELAPGSPPCPQVTGLHRPLGSAPSAFQFPLRPVGLAPGSRLGRLHSLSQASVPGACLAPARFGSSLVLGPRASGSWLWALFAELTIPEAPAGLECWGGGWLVVAAAGGTATPTGLSRVLVTGLYDCSLVLEGTGTCRFCPPQLCGQEVLPLGLAPWAFPLVDQRGPRVCPVCFLFRS